MRVTFINGSAPPLKCGVGNYGSVLLENLKDIDASLITTKSLGSNIKSAEVEHVHGWGIFDTPKIVSKINTTRPDLVHIQYPAVGFRRQLGINVLPLVWRILHPSIPVVITLHEYHSSALLGKIRNIITVLFAHIVIVSNEVDRIALPSLIRRKTTVIPIGSNLVKQPRDIARFRDFMNRSGLNPNEPTVVFFGFTNPSKGVDVLVESADKINAQTLLLTELGSDDYSKKIDSSVQKLRGNGVSIFVAGFLPDNLVSVILQECLIFTIPQPLPITAKSGTTIAAAQHNMIIISTANTNPSLTLPYIDNENCILIQQVNAENLASAVNKLIDDKKRIERLRGGSKRLEEYFSWSKISNMHDELYRKITK